MASELARRLNARLTVLHVIYEAPPMVAAETTLIGPLDSIEDRNRAARRELDVFLEWLTDGGGLVCDGVVRFGEPSREIVAYAEEAACDVVVVGTHGRRGLSRWLLGSVAEKVVRNSHVPVLTVRAEPEEAAATSATNPMPSP